jgi:hypothetical protein
MAKASPLIYYGVQATKTFEQSKVMLHDALAKVQGIVKGAIQIIGTKTSRQREEHSSGRDPLMGPPGQSDMGLWRIWHPTSGVIYDALEAMRRDQ